jgi:integrase
MGSTSVSESRPLSIPPGGGITLALVPTKGGKIVAYWRDGELVRGKLCEDEQAVEELRDQLAGKWTLRAWTDEWISRVSVLLRQEKLKDSSFASYLRVVRCHIKGSSLWTMPIDQVQRKQIRAWAREQMERGAALNTLRQHVAVLRLIFAEAHEDDLVPANPVSGLIRSLRVGRVELSSTGKALTVEEFKALLNAVGGETERHTLILLVMTGMRIGEAHGLWWTDVDFDAGRIRVDRQLTQGCKYTPPKTKKSKRVIDAPSYLLDQMKAWPRRGASVLGIEPEEANKYRIRLRTALERARVKAGLTTHVTPHALRHTYAVAHKHLGRDWKWLQEQLGHSSMVTTSETYAGAIPLTDRQAADELGEILRDGGEKS